MIRVGLKRSTLGEIKRAKVGGTVKNWIRSAVHDLVRGVEPKGPLPRPLVGPWDSWIELDFCPRHVSAERVREAIARGLTLEKEKALAKLREIQAAAERIESDPLLLWEMARRPRP